MKFVCLPYMSADSWNSLSASEQKSFHEDCLAYDKVLWQQGHWVRNSEPLQDDRTAKTLRRAAGKVVVTDGPYAETKEQLGGVGVLAAENLDEAVAVIAKHPCLRLVTFEIRTIDPTVFGDCTPENTSDNPADGQKIVCLGCFDESVWDALSPDGLAALRADCMAYAKVLEQRGGTAIVGAALEGAKTAKTLRHRRGKVVVTDGPYAETKEQIGGVAIYRFRDMAQALEAWHDHPCLKFGDTLELRPVDEVFAEQLVKHEPKLELSQD